MTTDTILKKSIAVEATEVARKFIRIYYPTIKRDPKKSHQFYMNDSIFTRIEDGKEPNVVVGQQVLLLSNFMAHFTTRTAI